MLFLLSRNEALYALFAQFYQTVAMETVILTKNCILYFRYMFASYMTVQSFITIKLQRKRPYLQNQNSQIFSF